MGMITTTKFRDLPASELPHGTVKNWDELRGTEIRIYCAPLEYGDPSADWNRPPCGMPYFPSVDFFVVRTGQPVMFCAHELEID